MTNELYARLSVEEKIAYLARRAVPGVPQPRRDWANQVFRHAELRLARTQSAHARHPDEIVFDQVSGEDRLRHYSV